MNVAFLVAIVAALGAPLATYLVAARRLSGKIGNSEATQLWEESRNIRKEYAARITELNRLVRECQRRVERLETNNYELERENEELRRRVEALTQENSVLRRRVTELEVQNE